MAADPASAGNLSKNCLTDTKCLAHEATKDANTVKVDALNEYVDDLGRLEEFDAATLAARRFNRWDAIGRLNWQRALESIAVAEVTTLAVNAPNNIVSFLPMEAVSKSEPEGSNFGTPIQCLLLADTIIHRSPWGGIDSDVSEILKPKSLRKGRNATLTDILQERWPKAIEQLPLGSQGWAWNDLANDWLEIGETGRAQEAVERAERAGQTDFQGIQRVYDVSWRTWLALRNYDRALLAADRAHDPQSAAQFKMNIAKSLISVGRKDEALKIIAATLPDAGIKTNTGWRLGLLGMAVDLRLAAGDIPGAHATADKMALLAHLPDIVPAGQFAEAAQAYNDLGDKASALSLLHEATAKIPAGHTFVGFGVTLGPITGATLGLADSLKSEIAIEFYRSGDLDAFNTILQELGQSYYHARTWLDLCESAQVGDWDRPTAATCIKEAGNGVLVHFAVVAAAKGDRASATQNLTRAISAFNGDNSVGAVSQLLNAARIAFTEGDRNLIDSALLAAAEAADNLSDPGNRESKLAEVGALRKELLP